MKEKNIEHAVKFLKECMQNIVEGKYGMDKLVITKSLRSGYKNPQQIAHKVLADRMGKRDSGNKPGNGDRIPYVYIENPDRKALQGERIETPDFIISNNALEHTLRPLDELKALLPKQKPGGLCIFVVPCENITMGWKPKDINNHLYSWSPMCLGNLFVEAGYELIESKPYIHKWPPNYLEVAKEGRDIFEEACRKNGKEETSWFQVRAVAKRK